MKISHYHPKYEKDMLEIFLWAGSKHTRETDGLRELMHATFCDYYLQKEVESCFIAINEEDKAIGYILCARKYDRKKIDDYLNEKQMDHLDELLIPCMSLYEAYQGEYDAHLHINVLPEYQRAGIGTDLMNTLLQYLKDENCNGVMLGVALKNEKGNNFYNKCGFTLLNSNEQANIMGKKIGG